MKTIISIERIGLEGQGVGYDSNKNIYFVPGGVPGDEVEVEVAEGARRYRDARILNFVRRSPHRREPECAYFKKCGGCDWLDWDYPEQLKSKEKILLHLLEKNQMMPEIFHPILGAERQLGYRNRIQLRSADGKLGFYARQSHEIVDIESCAVAHPKLNEELTKWREKLMSQSEPQKLELAVDDVGGVGYWQNVPHSAAGFGQVHFEQNQKLQRIVAEQVADVEANSVLELYCGNGNLTFPALGTTKRWLGIDSNGSALRAARDKSTDARVQFLKGFVGPVLPHRLPDDWKNGYDCLVLDPPRQGIGSVGDWMHEGLKSIVYVSCNPLQFVKEVTQMKKEFRLKQVQPLDMFPQTRHIEFIATLVRVC